MGKELDVWVPEGVKVFRRPSLMPEQVKRRGITRFHENHRGRGHRINRKKLGMVKARRDKELRDALRAERAELESEQARPLERIDEAPFIEDDVQLPAGYSVVGEGSVN